MIGYGIRGPYTRRNFWRGFYATPVEKGAENVSSLRPPLVLIV